MRFVYRVKNEGVEILRCFGAGCEVHIPETIDGRPVVALGPYAFSAHMREMPEGLIFDDGMGENMSGEERQPLQTGGDALCGDRLEALYLPAAMESIGRYAFYNCFSFRHFSFYTSLRDIGTGAYTGVRRMKTLSVTEVPGARSCLKEMLAELSMELEVELICADGSRARLVFPEFYEEAVENTPARILETHTHGSGHRYRYCFKNTEFQFKEYDSLFAYAKAHESTETAAKLALLRLMYPVKLEEKYAKEYRQYVGTHAGFVGESLLKKNLMREFKFFVQVCMDEKAIGRGTGTVCTAEGREDRALEGSFNLWQSADGAADIDGFLNMALRYQRSEAVSFLMELSRKNAGSRKKSFNLL